MKSCERVNKISKEVSYMDSANEFYKIGCVTTLAYIKFLVKNDYNQEEIIEYIEKTIDGYSDDLKLLYIEILSELKEK